MMTIYTSPSPSPPSSPSSSLSEMRAVRTSEECREEANEEEEEFHESFERIPSSSCLSASVSDDESPSTTASCTGIMGTAGIAGSLITDRRRSRNHRNVSFPPPSSSVYDVWMAGLSSVEERRGVLLQRLGLIGDPSLSRPRSSATATKVVSGGDGCCGRDIERSYTYPHAHLVSANSPSPAKETYISRARSDGSLFPNSNWRHKPPLAKQGSSEVGLDVEDEEEEDLDFGNCGGGVVDDKFCTIKNLDSGVEFVVKEVTEDGMWNKLKEVGTGRQLTMEEFTKSVIGQSPIVEELMRRQNQELSCYAKRNGNGNGNGLSLSRSKKRGSWLKTIKNMADTVVNGGERRSSDEKDTSSSEKGGRRSSSATDDSQELGSNHHPQSSERIKVRQYGRSWKELTGLYMNQEIHAHSGSIWTIKFSLDGRHLATAGEDCVIHVWKIVELERKKDLMEMADNPFSSIVGNNNWSSPELTTTTSDRLSNPEKRRRSKVSGTRKSFSLDHVIAPDNAFALSDKPARSLFGHQKDVLDLSWSKSKMLLSSSMDKTVKLWDMSTNSCLKTFRHSDYVTCIQFNPVDDRYFISGSLDAKVRLWSIDSRQVVDWNDLHEIVTAACFTPDGHGAFVGSNKGNCNFYDTSDNKLQGKREINLLNKKKKSNLKKITGFQFTPQSISEALITSADSRIRVVDDLELVHKFKGFRNTSSQISASITTDGKHVVCASEDSHVYIWRYDSDSSNNTTRPSSRATTKGVAISCTQSYEYFHCRDVSVAVAWPGSNTPATTPRTRTKSFSKPAAAAATTKLPLPKCNNGSVAIIPHQISQNSGELLSQIHNRSAWGMVIVTAGHGGDIRVYQNFGYPVHV